MKAILSCIFGAVLFGAVAVSAAGEREGTTHKHHFPAAGEIDVMTQNQYLGADLGPVLAAAISDPSNMNAAVVDSLGKIAASSPAERVRTLAEQIAQRNPDVVGLQEAYKFECQGIGCEDPAIKDAFTDHLKDTEEALRGKYVVAGKVTNLKVGPIPFLVNGSPALLSIADRDAILVRADLFATWVNFALVGLCPKPSDQGCNYQTAPLPFPTPVGDIAIERGFLAVDVTIKGRVYRVFNTHLEQRLLAEGLTDTRLLQVGQAYELLGIALATWNRWDGLSKKVIVMGDINSDPRDIIPVPPYPQYLPWAPTLPVMTPYQIFTFNNVFWDAWTLRPHPKPGLTCCQDEDLSNHRSELEERIDMIFSLPKQSHVEDVKLLGNKKRDKTDPPPKGGLWPSDHAALAATLQFK
jgi:endonuclease/exonuclease/phosphatase family metal-dependent hydrolase